MCVYVCGNIKQLLHAFVSRLITTHTRRAIVHSNSHTHMFVLHKVVLMHILLNVCDLAAFLKGVELYYSQSPSQTYWLLKLKIEETGECVFLKVHGLLLLVICVCVCVCVLCVCVCAIVLISEVQPPTACFTDHQLCVYRSDVGF